MQKLTKTAKKYRYAVLGGMGFIGSHIVDELQKQGHWILVIDNFKSGKLENISSLKNGEWWEYDITNNDGQLATQLKKNKIDYVFHLAAEPYIPDCYDRPEDFFNVNANGTLNVLMACREAKIKKIIIYSTSEVYGTVYGKISEKTPLNPQSTYAVSKLAGDRLAFALFHEHRIPVIILRQFNCYGERESHAYVIPEIISQIDISKTLKLGNIKAKRDFMYVKDAARLSVQLMAKGVPGEVYNLGTGKSMTIQKIAETIIKYRGIDIKLVIDKKRFRPFDVEKLEADNRKIAKVVKLKFTDFNEGIQSTIQWFLDNGHKWGFE